MSLQTAIFTAVWLLSLPLSGFCMTDGDLVRLKKSGIADETVAVIVRTRAIETGAYTINEIVDLKRAGMSEKSIRSLVGAHPFSHKTEPTVYGKAFLKRRIPTVHEIIALKNAGVSDTVLEALIRRPENDAQLQDQQRAWRMLDQMQIEVER